MLRIPFGRYIPGSSILHRLDPRLKIIGALLLLSSTMLADSWRGIALLAVVVSSTLTFAPGLARESIRDLWSLRLIFVLTIVIHAVLDAGQHAIDLPLGLALTEPGFESGVFFAAKIALMALSAGMLLRTTRSDSWSDAIQAMVLQGGKIGVAARRFSLTLGLAVRFLPLMIEEAERIRWAQIGRGLQFSGGMFKRTRALLPLLLPLMASSIRRAELISTAMAARGYTLDKPRSAFKPLRFKWIDLLAGMTVGLTMAGVIYL